MLLMLGSFTACKKDKTQQKDLCKNPTSYEDSQGSYFLFAYNSDSKLSELKTDYSSITFTYQNNGNTIIIASLYSEQTLKLGVDGLVTELSSVNKTSGEIEKHNYLNVKTNEGYDITSTIQNFRKNETVPYKTAKKLFKTTVNNGNLLQVKIIDVSNNNRELANSSYGYNISKNLSDYPLHQYIDLVDGIPFLSKNLVIRTSTSDHVNNQNSSAVYNYDFDEHDRILAFTTTGEINAPGGVQTKVSANGKFEYKCN